MALHPTVSIISQVLTASPPSTKAMEADHATPYPGFPASGENLNSFSAALNGPDLANFSV